LANASNSNAWQELRQKLAREREDAIKILGRALVAVYPDRDQADVRKLRLNQSNSPVA
jgi:hypothetical protein